MRLPLHLITIIEATIERNGPFMMLEDLPSDLIKLAGSGLA